MTLDATGFSRPRLADTKVEIDQLMTDALGPVNTAPDSVVGQLDGIWSEGVDNVYEDLQNTYDAMYPNTAEGTSLDGAVAFVGLTRIAASATVVTAAAYGTEGTLVPAGSLAHADIQYTSTSDVIISRANALDVTIDVATISNAAAYNILAGGTAVTFTTDSTATAAEIVAGLAALLNIAPLIALVVGSSLRVYAADLETPFAITVDSKLTISKLGSPVVFVANSTGANTVPVGALINIDTPVNGWNSIYNLAAGAIGRNTETDIELRLRHASSVRATGSATVEAIKSKLLANVPSVVSVQIYENRTSITNADGVPAKSYETVIVGGTDSVIAEQIWLTKPAGIETYGDTTIAVLDSNGDPQNVSFSRPVTLYGWLTVAITSLDTEETLPVSAIAAIKQAAVDYANANIGVGSDIIIQRFIGPVYGAVSGIGSMAITAATTANPTDTPTYGSANIVITNTQIAVFDISRVVVTGI
jgi:uncharacterized phage protein gp47/JayE